MSSDSGKSLTPLSRSKDVTSAAVSEGLLAGAIALVPSSAAVWYFMKTSPAFQKGTNWQSRTALAIMPPLFAFGWTAETKLNQKMHDMASESQHATAVAAWQHDQKQQLQRKLFRFDGKRYSEGPTTGTIFDDEKKMLELYRQHIENEGLRIVPGDKLGMHHRIANFGQENPFKILAFLGVPTVAFIFKGRQHQSHLQLQSQIMHTRVIGQFAVITLLLSLMGFKTYMDSNGKYITETDAAQRMQQMSEAQKEFVNSLKRQEEKNQHAQNLMKHVREAQEEEEKAKAFKKRVKNGQILGSEAHRLTNEST